MSSTAPNVIVNSAQRLPASQQIRLPIFAVARYLAAHSPTERAALQTADIARRPVRGGVVHEEEAAPGG